VIPQAIFQAIIFVSYMKSSYTLMARNLVLLYMVFAGKVEIASKHSNG